MSRLFNTRSFVCVSLFAAAAFTNTSAFAHATLEQKSAASDTYYKAVIRIGHGCDGEATNTLTIQLPEGFIAAKPMPKAGWTLETESGPFSGSYKLHGRTISDGVKLVRWTGGTLEDGHYDEFVVRGRIANQKAGTRMAFPTIQTCANGKQEWVELAAPGQDPHDLAKPAPVLTISAEGETPSSHGGHNHSAHKSAAKDGEASVGNIAITSAWTRQTPPKAKVAGGYLTVTNNGTSADTLIGGSVDFAERVEIHEMAVTDGVMRMKPVDGGLVIEPGTSVDLKPGGFHIMFMGVSETPKKGDIVPVTLVFEKAGKVTVSMPVAAIGATSLDGKAKKGGGHSHMDHSGHSTKEDNQ